MHRLVAPAVLSSSFLVCLGQAPQPQPQSEPQSEPPGVQADGAGPREIFPHVRLDPKVRVLELDGVVPVDCHDPETPIVYLEVVVCTPDTKEHESLVMTRARPSHVHAGLLALGLEPGKPGSWSWDEASEELVSNPPEGPALEVSLAWRDEQGVERAAPAKEWVKNHDTGERLGAGEGGPGFVFAGSSTRRVGEREFYRADGTGVLVGLTTFGSEVVAWREVFSHDSSVQEPLWIADASVVPKLGTEVVVRIRATPGAAPPASP